MDIKEQLRREIELRGQLKGKQKETIKDICEKAGVDYNGFLLYLSQEDRGMVDKNIQKVADALGKRFVLIDKTQ